MGKPYSDDLREREVAAIEAGHTRVKVAELYNMALSTVGGIIKRKRETGSVSPDKFGGYKTFTLEPHTDRVKELVAEQPDRTLAELQVRLAKEKVKVSQSGISRFLHHINLKHRRGQTTARSVWSQQRRAGPRRQPAARRVPPIARAAFPDPAGRWHRFHADRRRDRRFDHRPYPDALDRARYRAGGTRGAIRGNPAAVGGAEGRSQARRRVPADRGGRGRA